MEQMLVNIGTDLFGAGAVGCTGAAPTGCGGLGNGIAYIVLAVICYILGLVIMFQSLVRLSRASQFSGGFSPTQSLYAGPFAGMLVSAALIGLPSTWETINMTLFDGTAATSVLAYKEVGSAFGGGVTPMAFSPLWNQAVNVLILVVQFVGWIAFVRGILMLKRAAEGSGQASFGTAITHIVGGVLASNIVAFVDVLQQTLCRGGSDLQCLIKV
jgi:hypothetical protein